MRNKILFISVLLLFTACEKKPVGFGLEDSPIRYQTQPFSEPDTLAEVNGQKFTKGQILDKSPVLKDLETQENEALTGLAYLKIVERLGNAKPLGTAEIYLPESKTPLAAILNRFDAAPTPGLNIAYKSGGPEGMAAQYKDIKVMRDELDTNHVVMQNIEQRRFREIASQLNGQVSRILVSEAAAAKKQDLQSFLEKEVFQGKGGEVSDAELFSYLDSIGFARSELNEKIKPRFLDALKMRKQQQLIEEYVAANILKGRPMKVSFTEPQSKLKLNENWRPVAGYADAPVAMVAFSGLTCPDCASFVENVAHVLNEHKGHLKLNWIHNFNGTDGVAKLMAEASLCVDAMKPGKALEFMNAFAKKGNAVDESGFYTWAEQHKIDSAKLKTCLTDKNNETLIEQHREYAKRVGIVANPTIWVEGRTLQGAITEDQLDKLVSNAIKTKGSGALAAYWRRIKAWF
jgi:protein-disulfide isomerase